MGDPGGIGAEVVVQALADRSVRRLARWRVLGLGSSMLEAAQSVGIEPDWWRVPSESAVIDTTAKHDVTLVDYERTGGRGSHPREASKRGGELSFRFVEDAIAETKRPAGDALRADAIVTGPICKEAWALAGRGKYPGHTELLATRYGVKRHGMMFVCERMRVILATAHVPLMEVRNALTIGRVFDAIDLGHEACVRLGIPRPRIAVCGLNPHAGEGGLLGDEEERIIAPAIRVAEQHGMDARGPFPGDTIFREAMPGPSGRGARYDLVVAMYHDQGLIPVKLLYRDEAVNVTVGLPTVRTSPDHGTAFDIAGRGVADAGSMKSAMRLAAAMAATATPGSA
ncbi:MAG: 4-hydroxythreonine-4-phosphate dehydrogenase PdxA [Phycisphaerales bacterium]|nr:4-hydroxythreonine-4-phosphate dehydrogenase PdxA [Phycisphaerales bacterium]